MLNTKESIAQTVSRMSTTLQIEWLEQFSLEARRIIHKEWGYGAAECDCEINWPPCQTHSLSRFSLVSRAMEQSGRKLRDLIELSDAALFPLAFPEFEGRDRCDCPDQLERCEHAKAPDDSPLTDETCQKLMRWLTPQAEMVEPAKPIRESDCCREDAKSVDMGDRLEAGFGLYHKDDALSRSSIVKPEVDRLIDVLPNGHANPGAIVIKAARVVAVEKIGEAPLWLREERRAWRERFPQYAAPLATEQAMTETGAA